jgi:hypothetical protein
MKNIHVIPTDKPSRLCFRNYFFINKDDIGAYSDVKFQNIYITSDEEIKEGDWILLDNSIKELPDYQGLHVIQILDRVLLKSATALQCKKIILTTDFDLIFNGVQPIDDEFLEWFVKNPTCEFVKTEPIGYASGYNLDIPQEEPLPYQLKGVLDTMSQEEFDKEWKKVTGLKMESPSMFEEPKQETLEERACTQDVVDEAMRIVSGEVRQPKCVRDGLVKQQTLEEAARKYAESIDNDPIRITSFIEGAKQQAERMYSDRKSS